MKTLKAKLLLVVVMTIVFALVAIVNTTIAQTTSADSKVKFQKERADINGDLWSLKLRRQYVASLEKKYKADKKAGYETAAVADRKELRKAKADLKRDKLYLRADKLDLIEDHNLAIKAQRDAIKKDKSNLNASQKKLDKDLAAGNEDAAGKNAMAVAYHQKKLKSDRATLHTAKLNKYEDILAVNKTIKKVNGEPGVTLYAENAVANTKTWVEK